jgi:hypothetical protein
MTGPVTPAAGTGPDATPVYPLGSSKGETDRLLRRLTNWPLTTPRGEGLAGWRS